MTIIGTTASYYSDIEASSENSFAATSLDMNFSSPEPDFIGPSGPLTPGEDAARSIIVANIGNLPFEYSQEFGFVSGESNFCDALELNVVRNSSVIVYSGPLSSYSYTHTFSLSQTLSEDFDYVITLPFDASSNLRNMTCGFNLVARSWQEGSIFGSGFGDEEILESIITSGIWLPEAPILISPADGDIAGINSPWTTNPLMDWEDIVWDDPTFYYQIEIATDSGFTNISLSSTSLISEYNTGGLADGTYYWRVRGCDTTYGCGDWSNIWGLTIDNTIQEAQMGDMVINEIMWMGSENHTADEWVELRNMTGGAIILKNWVIEKLGTNVSPNLIIPNLVIPANGFFLIANNSASDSDSNLNVEADWVTTTVELLQGGEELILRDAVGNIIDQTPPGGWLAGVDGPPLWQSMERNDSPATGWHTCTDLGCNDITFWKVEGNNYGTPKMANLSANDPSSPLNNVISPVVQSLLLQTATELVENISTDSAEIQVEPEASQSGEVIPTEVLNEETQTII